MKTLPSDKFGAARDRAEGQLIKDSVASLIVRRLAASARAMAETSFM